jgi:hypothetical protein
MPQNTRPDRLLYEMPWGGRDVYDECVWCEGAHGVCRVRRRYIVRIRHVEG